MFSNPTLNQSIELKIAVIGDNGVGKTTFVNRFKVLEEPSVTDCAYIVSSQFFTSQGSVRVKLWNFSKDKKHFKEYEEEFLAGTQGVIIMFDLTSKETYKSVEEWNKVISRACKEVPIAVLGNKADLGGAKVRTNQAIMQKKMNLQYYDVSARANFNIEKPLLYLMRKITNNSSMMYVEVPHLVPPEKNLMSDECIRELEARNAKTEDSSSEED